MTRARTLAGALVLCVLSICAFAAANASAEGLTAVTCEELGPNHNFTESHCETENPGNGDFETVAIQELKTTEVEGDAVGTITLGLPLFGSKISVTCELGSFSGHITNTKVGNVHQVHGTQDIFSFLKCHVKLVSGGANEQCKVESVSGTAGKIGQIFTNALTWTNVKEHEVKFEVEGGAGNITEFNILKEPTEAGKTCAIPKVKVTVTGSMNATANTTKHSHLTFEGKGELKANGAAATFTGTTRDHMAGEPERTIGLETF